MNTAFIKDTVERAARTFLQGYLGAWLATGADFDGLIATDNLKIGATAVALSVAMSMGLKKVGSNKESGSVL
ncbi:MAG: holin [Bacteroidota bacterium]